MIKKKKNTDRHLDKHFSNILGAYKEAILRGEMKYESINYKKSFGPLADDYKLFMKEWYKVNITDLNGGLNSFFK